MLYTRISEVLELTRADLQPEGVLMRRRKSSKDNLVKWSPHLEAAINRALGMLSTIARVYLLHDKAGQPLKYAAVRNAWDRCMSACERDAKAAGLVFSRFTRHDLKAKGVSDSTAANPAGHKSPQMVALYRRKPEQVEPPK